jgi:hypothetical protein
MKGMTIIVILLGIVAIIGYTIVSCSHVNPANTMMSSEDAAICKLRCESFNQTVNKISKVGKEYACICKAGKK